MSAPVPMNIRLAVFLPSGPVPGWVARLVGDDELARRIAEQALPDVPERATTLRAQLEALLG